MPVMAAAGFLAAAVLGGLWLREARRHLATRSALRNELGAMRAERTQAATQRLWLQVGELASHEMLIAVDRQLRVRSANPAALQHFGPLPLDRTLMMYARSLELDELAREVLESDEADVVERVVRLERRPFRARVARADEGLGVALLDAAEMQRLGRARQDMVANLAHELRTPLTALRLLADTMQAPVGRDPATARDLATKITAEVDTLAQMTREMLDLAAIESGRQVIRLVPCRLGEVVQEAVDRLGGPLVRRQVQIEAEIPAELEVLADMDQAVRAVGNVLHNAVKFSPEGGRIEIRARAEAAGESVVLSVSDEGPGIPPDELDRIFERFFRGDRSRGTPGTGLGLAIVRHILRAHGGEAWAEDRPAPQRGAIFFLRFRSTVTS